MLQLSLPIKALLFSTGLVSGTIDAIAGGGGLITLPLLLGIGLPAPMALGTNKLQACIGTSAATYNYIKNKFISSDVLVKGLISGLIGASLGSLVAQKLSAGLLEMLLPFLLSMIFIYTLFSPNVGIDDSHQRMKDTTFYELFGFILGFYDGFFGPCVGSFWVISLVYFLGFNIAKATAYTKAFNVRSNVIALIWFGLGNNINYEVGLIMACGQLIGGKLGSQLVIKRGAHFVRPIFISVVFMTLLTILYKNYRTSTAPTQYLFHDSIIALTILLFIITTIAICLIIRRNRLSSSI